MTDIRTITLPGEAMDLIQGAAEVANFLWQREWAERNGGNISINLTEVLRDVRPNLDGFQYVEQAGFPAESSGMTLFATGTGRRMRDLATPERSSCVVRIAEDAKGYHILWGGEGQPDFRPTMEILSHLKIHLDKVKAGSNHCVVVHTHPIELIAISHHPDFLTDEAMLNRAVWSMLPEVRVYVPRGIGLVPYALAGSERLADLTVAALRTRDVALWSKHGALSTGRDAHEAFDFIDVSNKGAKIYLACLASGFVPVGLSDEEMAELVRAFKL
jgi:rhamnulose-1-phosphate aldolase